MTDRAETIRLQGYDPAEGETIIAEGVSYDEFRVRFADRHVEWLVGKVMAKEMKNKKHQALLAFLITLLNLFLGFKRLGKVYPEGISMYVGDDKPAREPDIVVLLNENLDKMKATYLDGAADFVVEVVSPESIERDHVRKLKEYEAAGVPEYWLLDPMIPELKVYALDEKGHYQPVEPGADGKIVSKILPGFALQPEMLWRDDLPDGEELIKLVQSML